MQNEFDQNLIPTSTHDRKEDYKKLILNYIKQKPYESITKMCEDLNLKVARSTTHIYYTKVMNSLIKEYKNENPEATIKDIAKFFQKKENYIRNRLQAIENNL